MTDTKTKIYIANLGKYNEGELVGEWIDLPVTEEELEELFIRIKVAHRDEDGEFVNWYEEDGIMYEEVAIHDYETDIDGLKIGEWDNITELSELIEQVEDLDPWDFNLVSAIIESQECDLETALDSKDSYTLYEGIDTHEELGRMLYECDCISIPNHLLDYFDFEAYGRDCAWNGEFTSQGFLTR